MGMSDDWNASYEATPASTEQISNGDDRIRDLKRDTRERFNTDHIHGNVAATAPDTGDITNNDTGYHRQVTLKNGGSVGNPPTGHVQIHHTGGITFVKDSVGAEVALVTQGENFSHIDLADTDVITNPASGELRLFQTSGETKLRDDAGLNYTVQTENFGAEFSETDKVVTTSTDGTTISLTATRLPMKQAANKNVLKNFSNVSITAQAYSTFKDGWSASLTAGTLMYLYLEGDISASITTGDIYVSTESDPESYTAHGTNDYYQLLKTYLPDTTATALELVTSGFGKVIVRQGNGHGSTNTRIRRFANIVTNYGPDITYADSSTLGASFTINNTGRYTITYVDYDAASATSVGISLNTSAPTTNIFAIPSDEFLIFITNSINFPAGVTKTVRLDSGDVIRPHTGGTPSSVDNNNKNIFIIERIG